MQDEQGNWWHAATMCISVNHDFERRVGALVKGRKYFVRVDAFNESGITEGRCMPL